jgi:spermidine/putrescine transport system permease protein
MDGRSTLDTAPPPPAEPAPRAHADGARADGAEVVARRAPRWARLRYHALTGFAALALLYLFLPIAVVIVFSFNASAGRDNTSWHGFGVDGWLHPFAQPGLGGAVALSLEVGALSTLLATVLGTLLALALARHRFRARPAVNLLVFLPIATPEIVLGSSLLTLFVSINVAPGFWTILVAHVMFTMSYVVVTVKARIQGLDARLEEAAMDLYAGRLATFRKVTLPLLAPGILAASLMAFALSLDDFVVTQFTSGSLQTFPLWIYGSAQRGVPVQVDVIGSAIFLLAVALMAANLLLQRRRAAWGR